MAVSEIQLKELIRRVERLETRLHHLGMTVEQQEPPGLEIAAAGLSEKERGLAALRRAGLLMAPSPYTYALAKEWRKRPKKERERIQAELRALRLEPPLSEVIVQDRR